MIAGDPVDLADETDGRMAVEIRYQVLDYDAARVGLSMGGASVDLTSSVAAAAGQGWQRALVGLRCFRDRGADMRRIGEPLVLTADGPVSLQLTSARIVANLGDAGCD